MEENQPLFFGYVIDASVVSQHLITCTKDNSQNLRTGCKHQEGSYIIPIS